MARTPPPRRPTDDDDDEDWSSSEEEPSKRDATVVISSDEEVGVVVASFPIRIHRLSSAFFGPAMREPLPPVTQSRMLDNLFTSESEGDVVGRGGLGMGEKEEVGAPGRMGSRLSVRSGNIPRPLDRLFTSESETEAVSAAATSRPKPLEKLFTSESEDAAQAKKPRVREMQREIPALQRRARPKYHYVVSSDSEDEVEEVALEELFSRTTISGGGRAVVGKSAASKGRGRAPKKGASTFILDGVRVDGDESSDEEVEEEGTDEFDSFINDEVVEDSEGTEEDDEATSGTEESTGVPKPRGLVTEIIDLLSSSEDEADDGEVEDDRPEDDGDSEDSLDSFIVNDDDSPRKKSLPKPPPETPRPKAPEVSKRVFDSSKTATAEAFLLELDAVLADGAVGRHYESRGGMRLKWNPKLLKTAGVAFVGRGEIELSTKVITSIGTRNPLQQLGKPH